MLVWSVSQCRGEGRLDRHQTDCRMETAPESILGKAREARPKAVATDLGPCATQKKREV